MPVATLPPFPRGWFCVGLASELRRRQIVTKTLLGREVVLFRTELGEPCLMDAYCPHLGAHMGHAGAVQGDTIRCKFHDFCFDTSGACVKTGYDTKPPPKARTRTWSLVERAGFLLAWFDEHDGAPAWELPETSDGGWGRVFHRTFTLRSHPQETSENSVDLGHLRVVHGYESVRELAELQIDGPHLNARYAIRRPAGLFGSASRAIEAHLDIHVNGLGYSRVEVDVLELGVRTEHFVLATPLEAGQLSLTVGLRMRPLAKPSTVSPGLALLPRGLANALVERFTFRGFVHDVLQDFPIWNHKRYVHPPALAEGDGPIGRYRKWAQQFYPDRPQLAVLAG